MSDDHPAGAMPDFIPEAVLAELQDSARATVAERSVGRRRTWHLPGWRRRLGLRRFRWWPLLAWVASVVATSLWLTIGPETSAWFSAAGLLTVLALVSSGVVLWRIVGQAWAGRTTESAESCRRPRPGRP